MLVRIRTRPHKQIIELTIIDTWDKLYPVLVRIRENGKLVDQVTWEKSLRLFLYAKKVEYHEDEGIAEIELRG